MTLSTNSAQVDAAKASMAPYIVRPIFIVVTVFVLLVAVCQIGGRIVLVQLDRF